MTQCFYVLTLLSCSVYIYIICHNIGVFAWFVNSWPTNKLTRRFFVLFYSSVHVSKTCSIFWFALYLNGGTTLKIADDFPRKKEKPIKQPSSWPMQYMSWCNEGFSIKQCQNSQRWFSALLQFPPPPPPPPPPTWVKELREYLLCSHSVLDYFRRNKIWPKIVELAYTEMKWNGLTDISLTDCFAQSPICCFF